MTRDEIREAIRRVIGPGEAFDVVMAIVDDAALDRMANKLLEETNLRSLDFRNGMAMEIEPARALAANFVGAARAMLGDAPNYSETPVEMTTSLGVDPDQPATWEKFAFIVQRIGPGKLTPHEARMAAERRAEEAERERDALRTEVERLRDQLASRDEQITRIDALVAYVKRDPQPHPEHDHLCPDDVLKVLHGEMGAEQTTALVEQVNQLTAQIERATAFIDKIRELAYVGSQGDAIVRRWILAEFKKAGWRDHVSLDGEPESEATDA